ncbi:segregation and condensation protein B [Chitinophaga dinghuensis]|uniref:Segregation and condensation protein B n=1 Tax=Chitinophaga dinghuensis TaxID=1539050 RepID=A0A327VML6_9BACT|nr:SMC-Scp complex subunit ScpB [Chitinophaga dinghuensis]RAJ75053.1 segregation and condensation protein B [Chitinophaga dinghuensis]
MEISQIIPHVEALIFAADRPLPMLEILDLLNNALAFLEDRATLDQVEAAIEAIKEKYSTEFYAFEVRSSGGGFQFLTKKDYYQTVAQLNGDKFLKRLSTAALETLAIIAYRQPISKGEIEYIRGVSTDYSIQKLLEKELIIISGRSEELPGKPLLYSVSRSFMDYFGINSPADLPKLRELFDEEMVQPTLINDETATIGRGEHSQSEETGPEGHAMMVSGDGELLDPDHQLDHLTSPDASSDFDMMEDESTSAIPASEDEEAEPDDEIIHFESFLQDQSEEDRSGAAEDEDAEPDDAQSEDEQAEEEESDDNVEDDEDEAEDDEEEEDADEEDDDENDEDDDDDDDEEDEDEEENEDEEGDDNPGDDEPENDDDHPEKK